MSLHADKVGTSFSLRCHKLTTPKLLITDWQNLVVIHFNNVHIVDVLNRLFGSPFLSSFLNFLLSWARHAITTRPLGVSCFLTHNINAVCLEGATCDHITSQCMSLWRVENNLLLRFVTEFVQVERLSFECFFFFGADVCRI